MSLLPMLLDDPQFKLYAICSSLLSLQMLFLGGMTAATRSKHKGYVNAEDYKVSFGDAKQIEGAEHPKVARILRAHRNLLESLPIFFALGLLCILAGVSPLGTRICIGTFTVARVLHSVVYIREMQPHRTILYGLGTLSLIGMAVQVTLAVLS